MDRLVNIINDIKIFILGGMRSLPISLAGTLLIIGISTANYAILFFLIGFLVLAPGSAYLMNLLVNLLQLEWFKGFKGETCDVVIPYSTLKEPKKTDYDSKYMIVSEWMAMMSFFIGYLITNCILLFNREADKDSSVVKVANRKTRLLVSMIVIILFIFVVLGYRLYSRCDSILTIVIAFILFSGIGSTWYIMLSSIGQDRLSDLFGIANRILSPSAFKETVGCVVDTSNA